MTLVAERPTTAKGVEIVHNLAELDVIKGHSSAAAVLSRKLTPGFQAWIDALNPEHLPTGRVILPKGGVPHVLEQLCEIAKTPASPERDMLLNDIAVLADRFADLMDVPYLRLRLEAVTTNACRKFHLDAVTARLVCTYRGFGTQYGTSADGNDPEMIFDVPTGSPILLRGSLWPTEMETGLLHRSPPIEGSGETRLVLVLDPIRDIEQAEV